MDNLVANVGLSAKVPFVLRCYRAPNKKTMVNTTSSMRIKRTHGILFHSANSLHAKNVSVKLGLKQLDCMFCSTCTRFTVAMVIIWRTLMSPGCMESVSNDKEY